MLTAAKCKLLLFAQSLSAGVRKAATAIHGAVRYSAWLGVSSTQPSTNDLRVLSEVHDARDDYAPTLNRVEDAERKSMNEQAPVALVEQGRNFWESAETTEPQIQMPHEKLSPARLICLVELVASLDVNISGEKKDKLTHCQESCREYAVEWPPTRLLGLGHDGMPPCDGQARQSARGTQELPSDERPNRPKAR